jgi:hypothetical protein
VLIFSSILIASMPSIVLWVNVSNMSTKMIKKTQGAMTKTFESEQSLENWLDNPLSMRFFKVVFVDWVHNSVRMEGRAVS